MPLLRPGVIEQRKSQALAQTHLTLFMLVISFKSTSNHMCDPLITTCARTAISIQRYVACGICQRLTGLIKQFVSHVSVQ